MIKGGGGGAQEDVKEQSPNIRGIRDYRCRN